MRRIGLVALLTAFTGCDRVLGLQHLSGDAGTQGDVGTFDAIDADIDGPPGTMSFGSLFFSVSYVPNTLSSTTYGTATMIHTDTDAECSYVRVGAGSQPSVCVVLFENIEVAASVVAIGDRPLALAAANDLTIDMSGSIDVSSHHGSTVHGAGGSYPGCATTDGKPHASNQTHAGGGAGGSFGETGGDGGTADNGITTAAPTAAAAFLRGGCHGGKGGNGPAAQGGAGGEGGGAVYLIAGGSIRIDGKVLANGAGGEPGMAVVSNFAGGGAGGSGGLIGLDATVAINVGTTGKVLANGGGGGGGADTTYAGTNGADGNSAGTAAAGGLGGTPPIPPDFGGDGGNGSSPASSGRGVNGSPGYSGQGGGGGGGGGEGYVRFRGMYTAAAGAIVRPPPMP